MGLMGAGIFCVGTRFFGIYWLSTFYWLPEAQLSLWFSLIGSYLSGGGGVGQNI